MDDGVVSLGAINVRTLMLIHRSAEVKLNFSRKMTATLRYQDESP